MDPDIATWVLDFLVRQSIDDSTLTDLINTLPLSKTDENLKKLVLLKKIDSGISESPVSESVLEFLEELEELENRNNGEICDSMRRAYCAVAVHCTVRFLEEGIRGLYFEAVRKIWRTKIDGLLKFENVGLVSDELISWKDEIENAVWDDDVCKVVLKKWKGVDVVEIVRVFVEEARGKIGPSFLELVAECMSVEAVKEVLGIDKDDIHKGNVQLRSKPSARKFNSKTTRGAKIVEIDDPSPVVSHKKYGCLSPPEVTKLREELRKSTSSLQATVKDPLPNALNMAKKAASNMESVDGCREKSNLGNKGSHHQSNATKASLMERNNTARTFEWDESTDGSAGPATRPHLPSPKKRVVSPLKKYEAPKPLRRKRKTWSNVEEDTLRTGVTKYGAGNWKLILNTYRAIFDDRTEVDLKDKWRNLIS